MRRLSLAALLLLLAACGSDPAPSEKNNGELASGEAKANENTRTADSPDAASAGAAGLPPGATEPDQYFPAGDYSARHILVSFQGAQGAGPEITRTKEEALAKAQDIVNRLQANPDQFEAIANAESDRLKPDGTVESLSWKKSARFRMIQEPLDQIEPGEISPQPMEMPDGYYIWQRLQPELVKHYTGAAFFIGFAGHPESPPNVTRTREEAQSLAARISQNLDSGNFLEVAAEYNDLQDGASSLGIIQEGAPVPSGFLETLEQLAYDEVSAPAALPFAYAFIKRHKVVPLRGAHILIAHKGAMRAPDHITRSPEEARELAAKLIEQANGLDQVAFAALAQANSDGPSAPRGGNLGRWYRGEMVLEFDQAIMQLEPNQVSPEPVKTAFGYHVILRLPNDG